MIQSVNESLITLEKSVQAFSKVPSKHLALIAAIAVDFDLDESKHVQASTVM